MSSSWRATKDLIEERAHENKDREGRDERVLELMPEGDLPISRLLPELLRPGDLRDGIAIEQLFTIGHGRRPDRVADRLETGGDGEEPQHGRPEGVRESVEQERLDVVVLLVRVHAVVGADSDGGEDETDV